MTTPAGWHPDANTPGLERYWDGTAWTGQTRPAAVGVTKSGGAGKKVTTWVGVGVAGFIVLGIISTATGGSGGTTNTNVADPLTATSEPAAAPTSAPPVVPAADAGKPNDKGWVVQNLDAKDDGLGDFGGTARITNANSGAMTATFTFTLARAGKQIATLQGSAQNVEPGKTVTVQLISQDPFSAGDYTFDFQTDVSY